MRNFASELTIQEMRFKYLKYIGAIIPDFFNRYIIKMHKTVNSFLSVNDIQKYNMYLVDNQKKIEKLINNAEKILIPKNKDNWPKLLSDMQYYFHSNDNSSVFLKGYSLNFKREPQNLIKGYRKRWLLERFDLSILEKMNVYIQTLPLHGSITVYPSDGLAICEEMLILEHAAFFLYKSKLYFEKEKIYSNNNVPSKESSRIEVFIRTYAIESFLNSLFFLECFMNSIAYHFIQKVEMEGNKYEDEVIDFLSDKSKSTIVERITYFPCSIKSRSKPHKEIKTDYVESIAPEFFYYKNLRDSFVHFNDSKVDFCEDLYHDGIEKIYEEIIETGEVTNSKKNQKVPIWLQPYQWLEVADNAFKCILNIAINFWERCGLSNKPKYLYELEYDRLMEVGKQLYKQETSSLRYVSKKPKPKIIDMIKEKQKNNF